MFVAIGTSLWIIKFAKDSFINTEHLIFTKSIEKEGDLLEGLKIKIPENESIIVEVKKTGLPENQQRYYAEFKPPEAENIPIRGSVVLIDEITLDFNEYKIMPMAVNFGGSGEFIYLILLKNENEELKHIDSMAIGDRVSSISLKKSDSSQIVFNYKSHGSKQAMYEEPTVPTILEFSIQNGKFVEGLKYFNTDNKQILISDPKPNSTIGSNFDVNFKAKVWLFENSSLVKLMSEDYQDLDEAQATSVDGEWMTSDLVSIKANLDAGNFKGKAKIILIADNPSDLRDKDKSVEYWVYIK